MKAFGQLKWLVYGWRIDDLKVPDALNSASGMHRRFQASGMCMYVGS